MYCAAMITKKLVAAPAGPVVLPIASQGGNRGHTLIEYV
jgi:hypothetical protein